MHFTFAESAKGDIDTLPKKIKQGLKEKLLYWQQSPDPLQFAKSLTKHEQASHRFRFGAYRVLVKKTGEEMRVLRVRHRKDVYR